MLWKCGWCGWWWWWCEMVVGSGSTHWHCISCLMVGWWRIYRKNAPEPALEFIGMKLWACITDAKFGWCGWYGLYSGGPATAPGVDAIDDGTACGPDAAEICPLTDELTAPLPMPIRIWCWWYELNWLSCIAWAWWTPGNRTGSGGVLAAFAVCPAIEK